MIFPQERDFANIPVSYPRIHGHGGFPVAMHRDSGQAQVMADTLWMSFRFINGVISIYIIKIYIYIVLSCAQLQTLLNTGT